jgi:hypothetical protein
MLPVSSLPPNLVPPGAVPGLPGQPPAAPQPAATPPIPGQQNTDEVKNRIMQAMQQISQQRQLAMRPVVPALPARQDPNAVPGYMQGPNWGPERFLKQSSALIHNAARKMQETRIQKAESDWNALAAAVETNNQSLLNAILSDPRKVKNMAKVFQMDWLNPKPTPHSIALSRVAQQTGLRDQAKKNIFERLFHALRGGGQQQPYSPQQIQEIESRLPTEAAPQAAADWRPVPGTNLEVNSKTGESRPIAGMTSPVPKSEDPAKARIAAIEDKIREEFAKQGLKPTFDDQANVISVSSIPGMPKPQPKPPATKTLMVNGKPMVMALNPATGKFDIVVGEAPPTWSEAIVPTKTITKMVNGIPMVYRWSPETKSFSILEGPSAAGAYAHEEAQAGAVQRAGEKLITEIQANRENLGTLSTWVMKHGLNTPIADPKLAELQADLSTFAALQPAMHGFRSHSALETFNKVIGGLQKNPDATIAAIRGILSTASAISPGQQTNGAPSGASAEVYAKDGKTLIGHIVNGKYVALPKK